MIRKGFYFSSKTEQNKGDRDLKLRLLSALSPPCFSLFPLPPLPLDSLISSWSHSHLVFASFRRRHPCGAFARHVTNEGQSKFCEARIRKTRRAQKIGTQGSCCPIVSSRQWYVFFLPSVQSAKHSSRQVLFSSTRLFPPITAKTS